MILEDAIYLPKGTVLEKKDYDEIVKHIPLNPIATTALIEQLKKVPEGEKPLDLIFAIKFRESKNNRQYSVEAYKGIVEQILKSEVFIPVCYGHQNKDNVKWEGRKIVGSVIGAFLEEDKGLVYYRIIPDGSKDNENIRRWIRNKQLNSISIWGFADSETNKEGTEIVKSFTLRSIDFVPPLSEGQDNAGFLIGEKHNEDIPSKNKELYMEKLKLEDVGNEELRSEFKKRAVDGRLSLKSVAGEMGLNVLTEEELKKREEEKQKLKDDINSLLEKAKVLGFKDLEELFTFASEAVKRFEDEKVEGEFNKIKTEIMTEKNLYKDGKPNGQLAIFIDKYAPIKKGMTREEIKEVIEKMLNDKDITTVIKGSSTGESIEVKGDMLNTETQENKDIVFEI